MSSLRLRRTVSVVSSALLALMLLGPATVSAATPTLIQNASTLTPTVKNGDYVAYTASIYNNDTSTVSQLYLVEGDSNGNISNGTFYSAKPSQGKCNATGPLYCSFGQLKPGKTASVTVVYLAPAAPEVLSTFFASFNTTGIGSGGGDNSHGDQWNVAATASLSNSDDFGGRYVANNGAKIVENLQALSNANPHSTRAYAPTTGIYTAVEDIDCTTSTDALCASLTTGFGQVSKVNVNNGTDVSGTPGTTLLHFTIQTYSSEVPSGKNANNIYVVHVYDEGAGPVTETISTKCTFSPKNSPTPNNAACLTVTKLSGGSFQVDVWTYHNGGLRLS